VLTTVLATIVVLSVLILVHEFGHFFAAKSVDIEVPRFSLGLGPKVWGFRVGETEFVLSALPLGGYVKMAGMEEGGELEGGGDAREPGHEPSPRDFEAKPLWARAWVVSAGVIMNLLFALLVFIGLAWTYGERIDPTTRVAVHAPELPALAPLGEVPFGAQITEIDDRPVQSWDDVRQVLLRAPARPITLRFADAPPVTFTPPTDEAGRMALLNTLRPLHPPVIGLVQPGTPAAAAGIRQGDRVLAAAGQPVRSWSEFEDVIRAHGGQPLRIDLERAGERLSLETTPDTQRELNAELQRVPVGKLGVGRELELIRRPLGLTESIVRGSQATWGTCTMIVSFLGDLITGRASPRNLGGPIAIGQLSGEAARFGAESFLHFMALLSINLAILNLLPIPILDGGHLMFMAVEAVRGRPLSLEQRMRLSHVGLIIVIGIMVWAMTNDVLRVFGV
jgi:regulator of sigma E protease